MYSKIQLTQLLETNPNIIFTKNNCPFCVASTKLLDYLVANKAIENYLVLTLDKDFDNETLRDFVTDFGWNQVGWNYPTKPQTFLQGKFVGDNKALYNSTINQKLSSPIKNPMW